MKSAKLGALFLMSVLALAGIGAGYASWTDTITIDGEVNTGSVGWYFSGVSGTYVWKVYNYVPNEIYVTDDPAWTPSQLGMYTGELIASSEVVLIDNHHATFTFDNLFPCIYFMADVWITYTGTVPGKINTITVRDGWMTGANADDEILMDDGTTLDITIYDENYVIKHEWLDIPFDPSIFIGVQLHLDWTIHVVMTIHLGQDSNLMGLTGSFDMDVEVVQWNLYTLPG